MKYLNDDCEELPPFRFQMHPDTKVSAWLRASSTLNAKSFLNCPPRTLLSSFSAVVYGPDAPIDVELRFYYKPQTFDECVLDSSLKTTIIQLYSETDWTTWTIETSCPVMFATSDKTQS